MSIGERLAKVGPVERGGLRLLPGLGAEHAASDVAEYALRVHWGVRRGITAGKNPCSKPDQKYLSEGTLCAWSRRAFRQLKPRAGRGRPTGLVQ
jgi:hypothetical protein